MIRRLLAALFIAGILSPTPVFAAEQAFDCAIELLRANADRFFVRCGAARPGIDVPGFVREIPYYSAAYPQPKARYVFDILRDALADRKTVRLIVEDDAGDNPPGCSSRNCRRIIAVSISP